MAIILHVGQRRSRVTLTLAERQSRPSILPDSWKGHELPELLGAGQGLHD